MQAPLGGAVPLYQSQGSITFKPQSEKSSTLRVAKGARQDRTMGAIRASDSDIGRPAWRRLAAMSAYSRAAELSKDNTRPARSWVKIGSTIDSNKRRRTAASGCKTSLVACRGREAGLVRTSAVRLYLRKVPIGMTHRIGSESALGLAFRANLNEINSLTQTANLGVRSFCGSIAPCPPTGQNRALNRTRL